MKALSVLSVTMMFLLSFGKYARAAEEVCVSKNDLVTISKDFAFLSDDPAVKIDLCDSKSVVTQVMKALILVKNIKLSEAGGVFSLQNDIGTSPYKYLKERVQVISFKAECSEQVAAFINTSSPGVMNICPHIQVADFLNQAAILIHEARHFDGYDHVTCNHSKYKGTEACDANYQEGGSYGIQASFFLKIKKDTTKSPVLRRTARVNLAEYLVERFNELPGDLKDGAFLVDTSNKISFFDGKQSSFVAQIPAKFQFNYETLNSSPYFVSDDNTLAKELSQGLSPVRDVAKVNGMFLKSVSNMEYRCVLRAHSLFCLSLTNEVAIFPFKQLQPIKIFGAYGQIFVTMKDGRIAQFPNSFDDLKSLSESQLNLRESDFLMAQAFKGRRALRLDKEGALSLSDEEKITPLYPNKKFIDIISPVIWSKSLQDI